ncbi:hypothetical protein C4569_01180, partial [Candidatus Parcubacteria bacterium]
RSVMGNEEWKFLLRNDILRKVENRQISLKSKFKNMPEKFEGEKNKTPESAEDQKHREFQEAMDEEERIMREIDNVLAVTSDRAVAEKIVLEKWAPLMDEAMEKSREALKLWLGTMQENEEQDRKRA